MSCYIRTRKNCARSGKKNRSTLSPTRAELLVMVRQDMLERKKEYEERRGSYKFKYDVNLRLRWLNVGKYRLPMYVSKDIIKRFHARKKDAAAVLYLLLQEGVCQRIHYHDGFKFTVTSPYRDPPNPEVLFFENQPDVPSGIRGHCLIVWDDKPLPKRKRFSKRLQRRLK